MADEKKGITVKIDANLHAEIREYLERHEGMTMAEFITLAVDDELHPKIQQKEGNSMGNMRTMAFQVPEELFQRIKDFQQLYREILAVADENGGKLKNRCVFFCDEFGTLPKIESAEMMFSASRSRRLQIVPIIQGSIQIQELPRLPQGRRRTT